MRCWLLMLLNCCLIALFTMGKLDDPDRVDIVAFSGHKLYAPYGSGALVVPTSLFAEGEPMLVGGGSACLLTRSGITWATGPDLEEAGSPNVIGVVAMAAALEELMRYGMERIAQHERELTRYAIQRLQDIPGLTLYGPAWESFLAGDEDRLGVFSFNMDGYPYSKVAAVLANEWGIGVRSGCFCAHMYVSQLNGLSDEASAQIREQVNAGLPVDLPGMARASLGIASTKDDIDRLASGLLAIARGDIHDTYIKNESGDFEPANDASCIYCSRGGVSVNCWVNERWVGSHCSGDSCGHHYNDCPPISHSPTFWGARIFALP